MQNSLNRSLTLTQLIFYGVGTMVGAGIYSVIGAAAGVAEAYLWVSFILAGVAAFLTVLSYAELSSAIYKAGAEYQFIKAAIPNWKLPAFMAGYLITLSAAATSATVSLSFAGYLRVFLEVPMMLTAFLLLLACTLINISGIRQATWVSIALTCIEVGGLLLVIIMGFTNGDLIQAIPPLPEVEIAPGILAASALIFFVYIGFEDVANLSEESLNPTKNIPRALLISLLLTSVIYILVAISVIAMATPEQLAQSDSPLTLATGNVSPWLGKILAVAAMFATASTALISLVSISRMLFGMARDGDMPAILSRTLEKRKTPWIAAITLFILACALLPLGQIKTIASVASFSVLVVFIGIHLSVIVLRYRQPELKRDFIVPFCIKKCPVLPVIGILISLLLLTQFEPLVYLVGLSAILVGAIIYSWRRNFC